jgi:ribosomal protein L3 glutamine methyltransferase
LNLGQLIRDTEKRFKAARLHYGHGTASARDEAAFLVIRGSGLPFNVDLEKSVSDKDKKHLESLIRKRIEKRIPAAYLLNEAWLDDRSFYVDRRVIIPRSHIAFMLGRFGKPKRVLDLCTGSGCLAILAAYACPDARIDASDISPAALEVAKINLRKYKLGKRIRLIRSNLFDSLPDRYDLIISNPPYVSSAAMRRLPQEYRYEPGLALAGGKDGLLLVKRIVEEAPSHLRPGGRLLCEIGDGRATVERALAGSGLRWLNDEVFAL